MTEQRNAGRRVISQADADVIAAKAGVRKPLLAARKQGVGINRRELLAVAMAGSAALLTVAGSAFLTVPDPSADPFLGSVLSFAADVDENTGEKIYPVVGGFAYPRIKAGAFGGIFTLEQKASILTEGDAPLLVADGKFYIAKVQPNASVKPVPDEDGRVNAANIMAIYQVCPHLGCLVPYIASEHRFICPCHGSTYERDTQYVRGPAPRNLDQFRLTVVNDTIVVNTGQRVLGQPHS